MGLIERSRDEEGEMSNTSFMKPHVSLDNLEVDIVVIKSYLEQSYLSLGLAPLGSTALPEPTQAYIEL